MDKNFVADMTRALKGQPDTEDLSEQREVMLDILLEQNPQKKDQLVAQGLAQGVMLGKNEGTRQTLAHLLSRKLQRALTSEELSVFLAKLDKEGQDAVEEKLLAASKYELTAWLWPSHSPKASPKKSRTKK